MSFSTFLILLSLSSDCADSFRELYSNSTFDQFYDQTVEGGLAPRIEGERLGALILDTRRMQIYLRPRELRSEDYFYFVNRRNQRLIGVITVHMHSWSPFISVYFNRYYRGRGYASEAYQALLPYVKEELQLSQLSAVILEQNRRSIDFHKKLGFLYHPATKVWSLQLQP